MPSASVTVSVVFSGVFSTVVPLRKNFTSLIPLPESLAFKTSFVGSNFSKVLISGDSESKVIIIFALGFSEILETFPALSIAAR